MEHGREAADEHVVDPVPREHREQALRIERGGARLRHGARAATIRATLVLDARRSLGVIASDARIWARSTPSSVGRSTRSGS